MNIYRKIALLIFGLSLSLSSYAQFPLDVQIAIAPPYPIRLSEFTDINSQIFVDVINNSTETYEIVFIGSLSNEDRGIRIETDPNSLPKSCIIIEPGFTRLMGSDLVDLFNPDYLKVTGVTIDRIRGDEALPEGQYTICLRAFDCIIPGKALSPPPDFSLGCSGFEVAYVDPPQITFPECGSIIKSDQSAITFNWIFTPPASGYGETRFKLRIVEIDPAGRNPFDVMKSATSPYLFESEELYSNSFNLYPDADILLEEGISYAFSVIAFDPTDEIQFRDIGESEVCYFTYGQGTTERLQFLPEYPKENDYIPFDFFPFILKFTPYSDFFVKFQGDFDLLEKNGNRFSSLDTDHSLNRWPRGPLLGQNQGGPSGITQEQSQHLPVYKNSSEPHATFSRGAEYAWQFTGEMKRRNGTVIPAQTDRVSFYFGMSPPILESPADNATEAPGLIKFQWTSAKRPSRITPPFDIAQFNSGSSANFFNGVIDEAWVIEVSDTISFDSIIFRDSGRTQGLQLTDDSTTIVNALYKQINTEKSFSEGSYFWRVKWLSNPEDLSSTGYSSSPIWEFKIGTPEVIVAEEEEETPEGCVSVCESPEITDKEAVEVTNGQTLKMGKFDMLLTSLTSTGTNKYDGEGEISIAFLNNVRVHVEFKDIKVNASKQVFEGKATAKDDEPHITADSISTIINGVPVSVPDLNTAESEALSEVFETGERLVSTLGSSRPIGMPLGLDNEIDGVQFIIAITEMEFLPRKASITAQAQLDIPDLGDKIPAFGARNVCITPTGFGDEYVLYLARDHEIFSDGETKFAFNGIVSGDSTKASYIEFDCTGFKCVSIRGSVTFPNDKLIPENEDGSVDEDGYVTGTFALKSCRGSNYLAEIGISAFQVKGMNGWGFKPITAYIDLSDVENPPDFTLPSNYRDASLSEEGETEIDDRLVNTWKGFYLKEVTLRAPPEFEDKVMGRAEFSLSNLIIDKTGLTAAIEARNIIDFDDGDVKGWSFALDTVSINIVQNSSINGRLTGKVGMPIFEEDEYLNYRALVGYSNKKMDINFRVDVKDTLNIPMWGQANMFFADNSKIEFNYSTAGLTHLTAEFYGGIDLKGDLEGAASAIPALNFTGIRFEGLRLSTQAPKFDVDSLYFAHASPQKSAGGFPVNIKDIGIDLSNLDRPGVEFNVALTLSNAGFSADVGFTIFGQLSLLDDQDRFTYGGLQLDEIRIEQTIGAVRLEGELVFYQDDPTYGNGMRGFVDVTMPMDLSAQMTVMFGTVVRNDQARFNTEDNYSYWYVDGLITIPGGVPIFSGFGIYGFGGGVYHHMRRISEPPPASASLAASTTSSSSGVQYEPYFEELFGLKITAVIGTQPSNEAFNMDVTLEATFSTSGGLSYIGIRGEGYIMASISERENAKVRANIEIAYHKDPDGGERVSGNFDVFVKVESFLVGSGENDLFVNASMHVDSERWYFYMGTPQNRAGLSAGIGTLSLNLSSYMMVGYGIPSTLPPLPPEIAALIYGSAQESLAGALTQDQVEGRVQPPGLNTGLKAGRGFAFGAALDFDTGKLRFAIFYARIRLMLGLDINFSADSSRVCTNTGLAPGINNWYATGQVYAGLWGELGVGVDLWFIKGDFPIVQLSAAIMMRGGLPNPAWFEGRAGLQYEILGGMVKGYCNFKVEVGEKCTPGSDNPFAGIDFIGSFNPENNEKDVSVFTYPSVSFNLPVNEILEFPAGTDEDPGKVRIFKPFIYSFKVEERNGGKQVDGSFNMKENNVIATYEIVEALESNKDYVVTVEVRAYEYFPNGNIRLIRTNGRPWSERKSSSFKSGRRPEIIEPDNVSYTYPIEDQAYFLQGESSNGRGLLKYYGPSQNYLFKDEEGAAYNYKARFIPLDGGPSVETRLYTNFNNRLEFDLPDLANKAYYGMQIIRKPIITYQDMVEPSQEFSSAQISSVRKSLGIAGTVEVALAAKKLPGEYAKAGEKILYKFYFRTSKFNTLAEKLSNVDFNPTYNHGYVMFENIKLSSKITESFDEFEINGVYKRGTNVLPPLLAISAPFTYYYHKQYALPFVYTLHSTIGRIRGLPVTTLNLHRMGYPPINSVNLSSDTYVVPRVEGFMYRNAAGITTPVTSSTSSSKPSKSHKSNPFATSVTKTASISRIMNSTSNQNINTASASTFTIDHSLASSGNYEVNFNLKYNTSIYVKADLIRVQQMLSRILSNPGYRSTFRANTTPIMYNVSNALLRFQTSYLNYSRGNYGIILQYRAPGGRSRGSSTVRKTFYLNL